MEETLEREVLYREADAPSLDQRVNCFLFDLESKPLQKGSYDRDHTVYLEGNQKLAVELKELLVASGYQEKTLSHRKKPLAKIYSRIKEELTDVLLIEKLISYKETAHFYQIPQVQRKTTLNSLGKILTKKRKLWADGYPENRSMLTGLLGGTAFGSVLASYFVNNGQFDPSELIAGIATGITYFCRSIRTAQDEPKKLDESFRQLYQKYGKATGDEALAKALQD